MPSNRSRWNKVIIFDWDDTICPSTFVDQCKVEHYNEFPIHFQNLMDDLGRTAEKCLAAAAKYGEVIIITNSDDGWVHFSASKFIPYLVPIISKYSIVSARTAYEKFYPGQPLCWKAAAFAHEVNETFAELELKRNLVDQRHSMEMDTRKGAGGGRINSAAPFDSLASTDDSSDESLTEDNHRTKRKKRSHPSCSREVISFGDSMEERTAVKIVCQQLVAMPKSVMFISSPTPEQLVGQLSMLQSHMKYICTHASGLDLEISPQQAEKCAANVFSRRKSGINRPIGNIMPRMRRVNDHGLDEATFSL
jgi:hypothetical protein